MPLARARSAAHSTARRSARFRRTAPSRDGTTASASSTASARSVDADKAPRLRRCAGRPAICGPSCLAGMLLRSTWLAIMAKRHRPPPKGRRCNMRLHFFLRLQLGKRNPSAETTLKTLDSDSRKCDSRCAIYEKGFRDGDVRGPFSFAVSVLLLRLPIGIEVIQPFGNVCGKAAAR